MVSVANAALSSVCVLLSLGSASPSSFSFSPSVAVTIRDHVWSSASAYVSRLAEASRTSAASEDLPPSVVPSLPDLYMSTKTPVPLIASKVSLPAEPATARLLDLLPPSLAAAYASPAHLLGQPPSRPPPQGRLKASPVEWAHLVRRGAANGMFAFTTKPVVVNGAFGIPKDAGAIRFIVAAQPANALFVDPPPFELPSPELLSALRPPDDESRPLLVASCDISDYYHRLLLPDWMQPYFALPPVLACEIPSLAGSFSPDTLVYPMCRTLPMGFSHAPFLAQVIHERLVREALRLPWDDRLSRYTDFRLDRLRFAIFIDDLKFLGFDAVHMADVQSRYVALAAAHGLPVKPSKLHPPAPCGEVVGMRVDGAALSVGLAPLKISALVDATMALVAFQGHLTAKEVERIVGRWVWAMLLIRPSLSVFSAVYRFIQAAKKRPRPLWKVARTELLVAVGLAPLLFCSLRQPVAPVLIATDASTTGLGVTALPLPFSAAIAAGVHHSACPSVHLGAPPALDANLIRKAHPPASQALEFSAAPSLRPHLLPATPWRAVISHRWRFGGSHINELEMRAFYAGLRWAMSRPTFRGRRVCFALDSMVSLGALRKGRSSSFPLLRVCRLVAAWLLALGSTLSLAYVPSELNPADGLSRR